MDVIKGVFKELFTVRFLHNGYGGLSSTSISDDLSIHADENTKKIFKNHDCNFKFFNDRIICFTRCETAVNNVPFIKFRDNTYLRFLLLVRKDFTSKTVMEVVGSIQTYSFSNKINVGTGGFLSMHAEGINGDDLKNISDLGLEVNCSGIIDIYTTGAVNNSYDLFLQLGQILKSPVYTIRFINKF